MSLKHATESNVVTEVALASDKHYANPFTDVMLDVDVTDPAGEMKRVPAFWAGGSEWRLRYASPLIGTHTFCSVCNHADDAGLHGVEGTIEVVAYNGDNPLYRHGPIGISRDQRHFEHHDGTPFLWLADTWWKGLSRRLSWEGFQELCADRQAKGFNTVQIVCGPYPDEVAFDPGWDNEGGTMYGDRAYTELNPEYFDYADRRLQLLVETGLMPALVGAWGRSDCNAMKVAGVDGLKRHWRYLVARYAAYPLVLVPGGEVPGVAKFGEGDWGEVVSYLCELDPFKRIKTSHEYACPHRDEAPLNDFEFVGGSHFSPMSPNTLKVFTKRYAEAPTMPLVCGETGYEGHMQRHFADTQRYVFWMYMLSGAAGHTYGAAGLHHMGVEGDPGLKPIWDYTTWQQAKEFLGATQVGMGAKLLARYPWHRFEPHPEWSDQDCYAAGIPGKLRMIYRSNRSTYDWTGPRIKGLEDGAAYSAFYFDPATGRRFDQAIIRKVADHPCPFGSARLLECGGRAERRHRFSSSARTEQVSGDQRRRLTSLGGECGGEVASEKRCRRASPSATALQVSLPVDYHSGPLMLEASLKDMTDWKDLGDPTRNKTAPAGVATDKGEGSPCPTNLVSLHRELNEADVMVSVEAGHHAEAGIVLRFQDLRNYIVGIYNPTLKAIFFFERKNGSVMDFFTYRIPHRGIVDVPEIGERFTLSAAACGDYVAMTIDDGERCIYTPPVKINITESGQVGLWRSDLGEAQTYSNVKVSKTGFAAPAGDDVPDGEHWIRSGEDIAPSVPSPQDWVLVMEKE